MKSAHAGVLSLISTSFKKLGLKLPPPLLAGLEEIAAERSRLADLPRYDADALVDACLDAISEGKHPEASEAVRQQLVSAQLRTMNIESAAVARLDDRTVALLEEHVSGIHAALAKLLREFDSSLAKARETLPAGINLADPTSAGSVQPDLLPVWGRAHAVFEHIDRIAQTWKLLATITRPVNFHPQRDLPLIVADLSAEELDALGHQPPASGAARAGHTLELAKFESFADRKSRIMGDRRAASDGEPTFESEYRRTRGMGQRVFRAPA